MEMNWYVKNHHHNYYSLVEPYRVDGRNRHRKIFYFGRLTQEELQRINKGLEVMKGLNIAEIKIEEILFEDAWRYLDVAFLNEIWDSWNLSKIFLKDSKKDIQTSEIAKILTLYRCLDPGSYLSSVEWFEKTMLDVILHVDGEHVNKSRIFRELDEIEGRKDELEKYLYETLKEIDKDSFRIVFYDLSDSHFEGKQCDLAHPGTTKSNGFQKKKIVLSLLINSKGYPFAWDILDDYTADAKTIKRLSIKWKEQFKIGENEMILVFDRGMVSDDNLKNLEDQKYFYITALDKNQIPKIQNVRIEQFESVDEKNMIGQIVKMGFTKYDDQTYYRDLGMINGRRYVLVFNPEMFKDERKSRDDNIQKAKAYLEEENKILLSPKKSRNKTTTVNRINKKLKKIGAIKFVDYALEPIVVNADGKEVKSFHIAILTDTEKVKESIKKARRTDGLWMIVTNIAEEDEIHTPEKLISAYRDKNQIEAAFKEVKSFIKVQPFHVWEPTHVKAHYTICVLSYLLDITIANRLREKDIGIKSPQKVYEIMKSGIVGKIGLKNTSKESLKLITLQTQQKKILELFHKEHIAENKHLKSIGINC